MCHSGATGSPGSRVSQEWSDLLPKDKRTSIFSTNALGTPHLARWLWRRRFLYFANVLIFLLIIEVQVQTVSLQNFTSFFLKDTCIGSFLIRSLHLRFQKGKLSLTQKQGVINIIPKKDKPREFLKNWRPISLLNVFFYKIASSCIANRIKTVLNFLIHENQKGFLKDRFIGENTRMIYDVLHYTHEKDTRINFTNWLWKGFWFHFMEVSIWCFAFFQLWTWHLCFTVKQNSVLYKMVFFLIFF